jgi:hypothetical protein
MQLGLAHATRSHSRRATHTAMLAWVCVSLAWLCTTPLARAQVDVDLTGTAFHESGGPLNMTVLVPSVEANVDIVPALSIGASWGADVVSGASVAVVDAPAADVDAISTATVRDMRNEIAGTVTLRDDDTAFDFGVSHAFENDYRSTGFSVGASTDLFERNTQLAISYARGFDEVCDVAGTYEAVDKPRMDSSDGCFTDPETRQARDLDQHTFAGTWTQAWTPVLSMQLGGNAQILHGFQANPYRAIRIGRTAPQEHHPSNRARYALSGGLRLWIAPLASALTTQARIYRDTWNLSSISAELAYEQTLPLGIRLRARGRYYTQAGASFYSDDYVTDPRGRYFTGDRELSPMQTILVGMQAVWDVPTDDQGEVLGFLSGFSLTLKADALKSIFDDFHYDAAPIPNTLALIGSFEAAAQF